MLSMLYMHSNVGPIAHALAWVNCWSGSASMHATIATKLQLQPHSSPTADVTRPTTLRMLLAASQRPCMHGIVTSP